MTDTKMIRLQQVCEITGLSSSTIRRLEQKDKFPKRRMLGARAVGWIVGDVQGWISESNQRVHENTKERASDRGRMIKSRSVSGSVEVNHE